MSKKFGQSWGGQKSLGTEDYESDMAWGAAETTLKFKRCHETHPVLKIGGGTVYGGSCLTPIPEADVYIGFEHGMKIGPHHPWERTPLHVFFPITDRRAPSSAKEFKKLIDWTLAQLEQGKTLHVGCVGGHGRTGLFLSALFATLNGDLNAITTVRNMYCKKAVESDEQVEFLVKHYQVHAVPGTDASKHSHSGKFNGSGKDWGKSWVPTAPAKIGGKEFKGAGQSRMFEGHTRTWAPLGMKDKSIWGSLF